MMIIEKDIFIMMILLTGLIIMVISEFKAINKKKSGIRSGINHKIIAVLIRHGGKMSCLGISNYLDLPNEIVSARIAEMEKKGVINRKGNNNDEIYLKVNMNRVR